MSYEGKALKSHEIDEREKLTRDALEEHAKHVVTQGPHVSGTIAVKEQTLDLFATLRAYLEVIRALQAENEEFHTLIACRKCARGVRPRYAVDGMCLGCTKEEIKRLRAVVDVVIDGDPHGSAMVFVSCARIISGRWPSVEQWFKHIADALEAYEEG